MNYRPCFKFGRRLGEISARVRPMAFAAVAAATHLLFNIGVVWAETSDAETEEEKSWVIPYAIVVSLVGIGMLSVCRPGQRKDDLPIRK